MNNYVTGVSPPGQDSTPTYPKHAAEPPSREVRDRPAPDAPRIAPTGRTDDARKAQVEEPISLDELAENLRRINLTFDLFEIEARFSINEEDKMVRVELRNTRTGEVVRRIPPWEFKANFANFKDGVGLLLNRLF